MVPNRLVGVSSGAIVATLYCAGMQPEDMLKFVMDSSMLRVIKFGIPLTGLTNLDYLKERLSLIWSENSFTGLKYPLHIGITNLTTGQHELRNSGPLHDSLAASCAIPFVFKPVEIDGFKYVDGGVIRNMPVEPLLRDTDFVIGSNLMPYGLLPPADISTVIIAVRPSFVLPIMSTTLPALVLCYVVLQLSRILICSCARAPLRSLRWS